MLRIKTYKVKDIRYLNRSGYPVVIELKSHKMYLFITLKKCTGKFFLKMCFLGLNVLCEQNTGALWNVGPLRLCWYTTKIYLQS